MKWRGASWVMWLAVGTAALLELGAAFGAAPDDGIVIYNAQHESLTKAWVEGFTRETGIKVTLRNGDDSELGNQIIQEGKASPADVFLTENSPAMVMLDNAGLLAPVAPTTIAQVAAPFRPAQGRWIGIAARSTVLVYNKDKVKESELPASLLDLAEPQWIGRWAASPAGADFQAIVGALLELKGEQVTQDWLDAMKAGARVYRGNNAVLKAVNAGQIDAGVIYHYYYVGDRARTGENSNHSALHYFGHKDPGAFTSLSGGAVLASSRHAEQAQAFLRWITSAQGQAVLREGASYEYAVGEGAPSNPKLIPLEQLDAPQVDVSRLDSRKVVELMTQAGLF
ncbi:iron(III) transport system substrate-binding protein [Pseudomonas nitritireducens]|uniref:Iron(III) transport system substrate-binding protein n=1 Tax=Pseudomonas nitroreducens TaxID=46680 RepID=A0A7W7P2F9_PSENT|nr:iron ABC transporter substrate-binding protein [Pseudomonas nitritireducens]MBB4864724.1 iron(III) transport system substrate-binding protein [Pseudomonas nitritireducens]